MSIITNQQGSLEYLSAQGIAVPHGFTTRYGGVSTGQNATLNLARNPADTMANVEENLRRLAQVLDFDPEKLVLSHQTHSDLVRAVTESDAQGFCHRDYPQCDGLITCTPGITLLVFTADCTPVLLYDPVTGAVGAVHAGWRGTAQSIAGKAVAKMARCYGSRPEDIRAAIGPNIAQCHFETHDDVPRAMYAAFGPEAQPYIVKRAEKYYVDLKGLNALCLRLAGVRHVEISDACTCCEPQRFWSHRATQGLRGSQGALITCKGGIR